MPVALPADSTCAEAAEPGVGVCEFSEAGGMVGVDSAVGDADGSLTSACTFGVAVAGEAVAFSVGVADAAAAVSVVTTVEDIVPVTISAVGVKVGITGTVGVGDGGGFVGRDGSGFGGFDVGVSVPGGTVCRLGL